MHASLQRPPADDLRATSAAALPGPRAAEARSAHLRTRAEEPRPSSPQSARSDDPLEDEVVATRPARVCPHCAAPTSPGMSFCRECGTPLRATSDAGSRADARAGGAAQTEPQPVLASAGTCWRCQSVRDQGASFCRYCGASFVEAPATALRLTPPQSSNPVGGVAPALAARLVTLLKDGSEGRSIPLAEGDADIGAAEGDVVFPDDPYMSPRHARVSARQGTYILRDLDSVNGVYVRLRDEVDLLDRDLILIGQQVLRFEALAEGELSLGPAWQRGVLVFGTPEAARFARLVQYTTEGVGRDVHYLFRDETVIGRENGDIVFTDDPFLSRRHAAVRVDHASRRFTLHDLGSSNGTALRIRGEHVLRDGDQFRIGRHLFRFEAGPAGGRAGR